MCGLCVDLNAVPHRDRIRAWVDALDSGLYEQTTNRLYRGPEGNKEDGNFQETTGYCCLGVACLVAERSGVDIPDDWRQERVLPAEVRDWFGLPNVNPKLAGNNASTWNDAYGLGFGGIAALIRNEYLKDDDEKGSATA